MFWYRFLPLQKRLLDFTLTVVSHTCFPIFPDIWVSMLVKEGSVWHVVTWKSVLILLWKKKRNKRNNLFASLNLCGYVCRGIYSLNRGKAKWQGTGYGWTGNPLCPFWGEFKLSLNYRFMIFRHGSIFYCSCK